jgi:FkbM family methyltransferase
MGWRRFVARSHRRWWARGAAKAARTYLDAWQNLDYDLDHNGERTVVDRLRPAPGAVVLDVGANLGDWARAVRAAHPATTVHAFEVVPGTAAALAGRLAGDPGVVVHAVGLAEVPGTTTVWVPERSTRGASLVRSDRLAGAPRAVTCPVTTGDEWLASAGRPHVALVKVDVEGVAVRVLAGFAGALAEGAVDAVQFEWNEWSTEAGTSLGDHVRPLEEAGYVVGRIHPDGVAFAPYHPRQERGAPGNFLAVRTDLPAVVAAVATGAARGGRSCSTPSLPFGRQAR